MEMALELSDIDQNCPSDESYLEVAAVANSVLKCVQAEVPFTLVSSTEGSNPEEHWKTVKEFESRDVFLWCDFLLGLQVDHILMLD